MGDGRGGHLGHVTQMPQISFGSPNPWTPQMKFGFDWRRKSFKMVDRQQMDDGACLYYKLNNEPKGSGELKTYVVGTH